jgi:hypothetical protein
MSINLNKNQLRTALEVPPYYKLTPKFTIYKKDTTVYAMDEDGNVPYSGSDAAEVINAAIAALTPGRTWEETILLKGLIELNDTVDLSNYSFTKILIDGKVVALSGLSGKPMFKVSTGDLRQNIAVEGLGGLAILDGAGYASQAIYMERTTAGSSHGNFSIRNLLPMNFTVNAIYLCRIFSSIVDWIYAKNCPTSGPVIHLNICWDDWISNICVTGSSGANMKVNGGEILGGNWYIGGSSGLGSYQLELNVLDKTYLTNIIIDYVYCSYGLGVTGSPYALNIQNLLISGPFKDNTQVAMRVYGAVGCRFSGRIDKKDSTYTWATGIKEEGGADRNIYEMEIRDCATPIVRTGANSIFRGFIGDLPLKKLLTNQSIGTSETAIAHGLGITPNNVLVFPYSNAVVYRSRAPDATNIYLIASAACSADIYVSYE